MSAPTSTQTHTGDCASASSGSPEAVQSGAAAARHQPKTALPWCVSARTVGSLHDIHAAHGRTIGIDVFGQDARYIVRAANAYPKLVAALKAASSYMHLHKYADRAWADDIDALLRDLGELDK